MSPGKCFRCHQPGHWANNCLLKTPKTTDAVTFTSPPVIHCPCNGGVCKVLTSKTTKNPNRRFYTCPSCGFFKWCDQVSVKSEPKLISDYPTCTCGSGPCTRVTVIDGPNAQRSYFVCSIKKGFGACQFFKWEDEVQILSEVEEVGNGGSPCSTLVGFDCTDDDENLVEETELDSDGNVKSIGLGVLVGSDFISTKSNKSTTLSIPAVEDIADTLPINAVTMGNESIPVCSSFNNRKPVSDRGSVPSFDLITVYDDAVHVEMKEELVSSLGPKHIEPQVEALCGDHPTNGASLEFDGNGKSYGLEDLSQNTSNPNGKIKPEYQDGETEASSSGSSSLVVDLIEQYNSEKLHFENVSMKHVDALTAFTGSYKQLATLRGKAHSLRKQLFEVEAQVKLYEAESLEFAVTLQEVSAEMEKSQKKMAETAMEIAKEVKGIQTK